MIILLLVHSGQSLIDGKSIIFSKENVFRRWKFYLFLLFSIVTGGAFAQDNYEIQVYGADTIEKGKTMLELHSNYTFEGNKETGKVLLPTNHIIHETIEVTHGFTSWFEVGFHLFNAVGNNNRTSYVSSHIRPGVSAPTDWHLSVGLSFPAEFGFQKKEYSASTSTLELRPIIDKKWKAIYLALNPVLGKSFKGTVETGVLFFLSM